MKKKIVLGLSAYLILLFSLGLYIVYTIQTNTTQLSNLIKLHEVEHLREHFLIQVKRVQSDIAMKHTRHPREFERVVFDVTEMEKPIRVCYGCHHAEPVQAGLNDLRDSTRRYKEAVSRTLTLSADSSRLAEEEDIAIQAGDALTEKVRAMVNLTTERLQVKTEKVLKDISRAKYIVGILLSGGMLLYLGLATIFVRGFTTPLNRLLEATRILKSGNLDHRVQGLKDEFGELGSSFNEMSDAIRGQVRQMRETEQSLAKANRDLRRAQEQMVRAETMAALGTLSSGISHQLSTPLSVILNMTQLMKHDVRDSPEVLKDLEVLEYEANQAIKVTRSLLGFTRTANAVKEHVDVNKIVEDILKIMEFQTAEKLVKVKQGLAPGLRPIYANSANVRQVFLNIILNAIQAMPDGGELVVTSGRNGSGTGGGVEVTVADTGSGIPAENLEDIFQPFFTTKKDGTGLGLAITYGIVQEHNGSIFVESEVGRGTTFRVILPQGEFSEART